MDTNSPNHQSQPQQKTISPVEKTSRLPIILLIAIAVVLLLSILIYFKVIPLQNFIRPQSNQPISTSTTNTESVNADPIKIHCPTIKVVCDQGYGVFEDQRFFGLGYKLASKNPIYAAFDGTLTTTNSDSLERIDGRKPQEKFVVAYLNNKELNRRAQYYLKGSIDKDGPVQKGEQIGTVNGDQIGSYNNSSLVFSLFLGDSEDSGAPIIIHNGLFE